MSEDYIPKFIEQFTLSLKEGTFVKMTLGNYKGADKHLQKLLIRLIKTKKGVRLFFLYRYDTRDTAKNYGFDRGIKIIRLMLGSDFFAGHLFTTSGNYQLDIGKKGGSRLNTAKPTFVTKPGLEHNKPKKRLVDRNSFYLNALGITNEQGDIKAKQQGKWKQINKFIETLSLWFGRSALKDREKLKVVDMGSGKGYLTFAAYDFFKNSLGIDTHMIGVDTKQELVELCNDVARACEFDSLDFEFGEINNYDVENTDILIALHACDTATDDAIYAGIKANAELIFAAPCCHREVRPQITPPKILRSVLKHGAVLEREAESITDGLRSLLLEKYGYSTKIFEFVSTEHTPKNNMIVGQLVGRPEADDSIGEEISDLKKFYGIRGIRLEELLSR